MTLAPCLEEPTGIAGQWLVREVTYTNGKPKFKPKSFQGVTFGRSGLVAWHDGCNQHMGNFSSKGDAMTIRDVESTLVGCFDEEDIQLHETTKFKLVGDDLVLFTPTQAYKLARNPDSILSRSAWSLFAITNRQTGESTNVDRFRLDYRQLLLETEADKLFTFTDLDYAELNGNVRVTKPRAVKMTWSQASRRLLAAKVTVTAPLPDANQGYKQTTEPYPNSWAHLFAVDEVTSFCVVESVAGAKAPPIVLELRSDRHIYTFAPR